MVTFFKLTDTRFALAGFLQLACVTSFAIDRFR